MTDLERRVLALLRAGLVIIEDEFTRAGPRNAADIANTGLEVEDPWHWQIEAAAVIAELEEG